MAIFYGLHRITCQNLDFELMARRRKRKTKENNLKTMEEKLDILIVNKNCKKQKNLEKLEKDKIEREVDQKGAYKENQEKKK